MAREALFNLFYEYLHESDKIDILREAQIYDDRPSILRDEGGKYDDGHSWLNRHRKSLMGPVLRRFDLPNSILYQLHQEGDFNIGEFFREEDFILRLYGSHDNNVERHGRPLITEIAVASSIITAIYFDYVVSVDFLGISVPIPQVSIKSGSVNVAMSGSLFTVGLGLLIACNEGLLNAPVAGELAGSALAAAGMIELVLGWRHKAADTARIRMDTLKSQREYEIKDIEIKLKQLELQKAQLEIQTLDKIHRHGLSSSPTSGFIPREFILGYTTEFGLTEAFANHIINRVLPKFLGLRHMLHNWVIERK